MLVRYLRLVDRVKQANDAGVKFATMGERIWFAWHCLPRDEYDRKPSLRSLGDLVDLPHATINKHLWDRAKPERASMVVMEKLAKAFATTPGWLLREEGQGPVADRPVVPRPAAQPPIPRKKRPAPVEVTKRRVS